MTDYVNNDARDVDISHYCFEDGEKTFANVIGCIEDTIISDRFLQIQSNFLEKYYKEFEDIDENRLIYMDIFQNYLLTVEKFIENQLVESIPNFDIKQFELELQKKRDDLNEEIYEMLSTFWNFNSFKEMFLEYKKIKEGKATDFSKDILVTKYNVENTSEQKF